MSKGHGPIFECLKKAVCLLGKCQMFIRFMPDETVGRDRILHELSDFDRYISELLTIENIKENGHD